jgi:hypothetical protein
MNSESKKSQWHFRPGQVVLLYATGIILGLAIAFTICGSPGQSPLGPALTGVAMVCSAISVFATAHKQAADQTSQEKQDLQ